MVLCCCVYGCNQTYDKNSNISFHNFPKDPQRRKIWTIQLKRKNFVPTDYTKICSKHFTEDCFNREKFGGRWLKDTALPTVFDFPEYLQKRKSSHKAPKKQLSSKKRKLDAETINEETSNNASSLVDNAKPPKRRKNMKNFKNDIDYLSAKQEEKNFEEEETFSNLKIVVTKEQKAFSNVKQIEDDIRKELSDEMQMAVQSSEIPKDDEDELLNLKLELNQAYTDINILTRTQDVIIKELSAGYDNQNSLNNAISKKEGELSILKLELEQAHEDINILSAQKDSFVKKLEFAHSKQKILEHTISENQEKLEKNLEHAYAEIDALRKERDKFHEKLTAADATRSILHDRNKLHFYTGLNSAKDFFSILMHFCDFGKEIKTISIETKFLMVLMRLRLNLLYEDIGYRFDASAPTVSRLCEKTIPVLEKQLEEIINNSCDDVSNKNLPVDLKKITLFKDLLQRIRKYSKM